MLEVKMSFRHDREKVFCKVIEKYWSDWYGLLRLILKHRD